MSDSLRLTIVIDALREILTLRFGEPPEPPDPADSDSLELTIAA